MTTTEMVDEMIASGIGLMQVRDELRNRAKAAKFESGTHGELKRVFGKIGESILDFYQTKMTLEPGTGRQFHLVDLYHHVKQAVEVSPNSSARILQYMRREGIVNYVVLSRSESLYEVLPLGGTE
jgi:hypothetical protein